jgi:Importin-beta N-terminal domain
MTQPAQSQLTQCLQSTQSTNKAQREEAEAYLRRLEQDDWGAFVAGLSQELVNEGNPEVSRQVAGLLLKNALDAKDSHVQVRCMLSFDRPRALPSSLTRCRHVM